MGVADDYGIKIDPSANEDDWWYEGSKPDEDTYRLNVENQLTEIAKNPVGRLVLSLIKADDDDLTIVPFNDRDAKIDGVCNNASVPKSIEAAAPEGENIYQGRAAKDHFRRDGRYVLGTGKGSDVVIHFTADRLRRTRCTHGDYASKPDEALFHEMIHALRAMEGHLNKVPTKDSLYDYEHEEEFLAIVVTNIYISAKANPVENKLLRANHNGFSALAPPFNTSAGFLSDPNNVEMLAKHYWNEFPLYQALRLIDCAFNPIRELVNNGKKYHHPEMSPLNIPRKS